MFDALPAAAPTPTAPHQPAPSAASDLNLANRAMREEYLNRELEVELATAWREHGDERAKNRLVQSHLRLASKMAHKMKRKNDSVNDLMQEASMGLMKAADKFDPEMGFRFATYAVWWVRVAIQEAIMRDNSSVRLKSSSMNRTVFYNHSRVEARAEMKLRNQGIEPTVTAIREETARMMGIETSQLEAIIATMPSELSLNESARNNDGDNMSSEMIDLIPSRDPDAEELAIRESSNAFASNAIAQAMESLTEREMSILRRRTMSLEPHTLEVLSQEYGITRERVRQIEARSLEKMKKSLKKLGITDLAFLSAA